MGKIYLIVVNRFFNQCFYSLLICYFYLLQATREFLEKVNAKYRRKIGPIAWSTAVRFLYARKFDVVRALALFDQHESTRQREGLCRFDPLNEPLQSELLTGKFTVLVSHQFLIYAQGFEGFAIISNYEYSRFYLFYSSK